MATLVYKRTHTGDPDEDGIFGCHGCMGRVRSLGFDAVIGIGGIGPEPKRHGIDRKLNWIGKGAHEVGKYRGAPLIAFDHFQLFDADGDDLLGLGCKALVKRFYTSPAPRYVLDDFNDEELSEIESLLELVENKGPSKGKRFPKGRGTCPPKSGKGKC